MATICNWFTHHGNHDVTAFIFFWIQQGYCAIFIRVGLKYKTSKQLIHAQTGSLQTPTRKAVQHCVGVSQHTYYKYY